MCKYDEVSLSDACILFHIFRFPQSHVLKSAHHIQLKLNETEKNATGSGHKYLPGDHNNTFSPVP